MASSDKLLFWYKEFNDKKQIRCHSFLHCYLFELKIFLNGESPAI